MKREPTNKPSYKIDWCSGLSLSLLDAAQQLTHVKPTTFVLHDTHTATSTPLTTVDMHFQAEADVLDEFITNHPLHLCSLQGSIDNKTKIPQVLVMISLTLLFLFTSMLIELELFSRSPQDSDVSQSAFHCTGTIVDFTAGKTSSNVVLYT